MNKGRVGEERGGKEMDGCPLTVHRTLHQNLQPMQLDEAATLLTLWRAPPCRDSSRPMGHH
jgi:hypothetical protein